MKVFAVFSSILLCSAAVLAAPKLNDNHIDSSDSSSTFSRAAKFLGSCFESDDLSTCLAVKGITLMSRAARSKSFELTSGITFKRNPDASVSESGRSLSEKDIMAELSEKSEDKSEHLMGMALDKAVEFFQSHSLEIKVPTEEIARSFDEGRLRFKKKKPSPLLLLIGAKIFALVPILLGVVALLSTKALIVGKIALLMALALGGSRFFGGSKLGNVFGNGANAGWVQNPAQGYAAGGNYPYARSIKDDSDAQELAYSGQIEKQQ